MKPQLVYPNTSDQELYSHLEIQLGNEPKKTASILAATVASSAEKPNEDAFAVTLDENVFFVGLFDGTTSLKSIESLGVQTGARFASHFMKDNFSQAESIITPQDLMLDLNQKLLKKSLALGATLSDTHTLPATTGTIIKIDSDVNTLSFAHVGDSFGIIYFADGHSRVFTDDKNSVFDERIFALIAQIAEEKNITHKEARQDEKVKEALIQMYIERNNNPNGTGSGLINGDINVDRYIQADTISLDGITSVLLGSDGLPPQGWSVENEQDRQKMLDTIRGEGFRKLFELKHQSEDVDPEWQNIRYKHSDDGTGLLISLG